MEDLAGFICESSTFRVENLIDEYAIFDALQRLCLKMPVLNITQNTINFKFSNTFLTTPQKKTGEIGIGGTNCRCLN